jgi:hypothetical protein
METREFPKNYKNALAVLNGKFMKKIQALFISGYISKSIILGAITGVIGE